MAFWLSRIEIGGLFDIINDLITEIKRMSDTLQDTIAQLTADVQASRTVQESAITLLQGIPQMIQTAVAAASAGGATPQQLQALNDLHSQLQHGGRQRRHAGREHRHGIARWRRPDRPGEPVLDVRSDRPADRAWLEPAQRVTTARDGAGDNDRRQD
jgi:hypothetical protein